MPKKQKVGLLLYTVRVHPLGSPLDWETLDQLVTPTSDPPLTDFYNTLLRYLTARQTSHVKDDTEQTFLRVQTEPSLKIEDRMLAGRMEYGTWGTGGRGVNPITGEQTYTRGPGEPDLQPTYFRFEIPKGANEGVVVLQKTGVHGIKTPLSADIARWMEGTCATHRVVISNLAPKQWIDSCLAPSRITKLRLLSTTIPDDVASQLGMDHKEDLRDVEYVVSVKPGRELGLLGKLREVFMGGREPEGLVEIQDFAYDKAKIEFKLGRGTYTMDVGSPSEMAIPFDITDEVATDAEGHPDFDCVDKIASELIQGTRAFFRRGLDDARKD